MKLKCRIFVFWRGFFKDPKDLARRSRTSSGRAGTTAFSSFLSCITNATCSIGKKIDHHFALRGTVINRQDKGRRRLDVRIQVSWGTALTIIPLLLLAGCVSEQKYDALQTRYDQLQQTMSSEIGADQMHIERLQDAIKVTLNSELLFPRAAGACLLPRSRQCPK